MAGVCVSPAQLDSEWIVAILCPFVYKYHSLNCRATINTMYVLYAVIYQECDTDHRLRTQTSLTPVSMFNVMKYICTVRTHSMYVITDVLVHWYSTFNYVMRNLAPCAHRPLSKCAFLTSMTTVQCSV